MKKFQATIHFEMGDRFMSLVPAHRTYINNLIDMGIVDQYVVSMESQRVWITFTADNAAEVKKYLAKSPLYSFWTYEIDELFVYDGAQYRLPHLQFN